MLVSLTLKNPEGPRMKRIASYSNETLSSRLFSPENSNAHGGDTQSLASVKGRVSFDEQTHSTCGTSRCTSSDHATLPPNRSSYQGTPPRLPPGDEDDNMSAGGHIAGAEEMPSLRRPNSARRLRILRSLGDDSSCIGDDRSVATLQTTSTALSFDDRYEVPQDLLMFFQASPLVYTDTSHRLHAVEQIDFDTERDTLKEAIEDAPGHQRIAIAFETATAELLGRFLAKGEGRVLHFSCHGHSKYLFVEDGWAHAQPLFGHDLQSWIQMGGARLELVFVSACYSRTVGEAFIGAGVPHVVCCQKDSQRLHNVAAVEFEKAFYHALACGRRLQRAFDLACESIKHSPLIPWEERREEVKKFTLLPEGANHDVDVFFTQPLPPRSTFLMKRPPIYLDFPPPPSIFIGREVEMYRVIDSLKHCRLVRIAGPAGVGTNSLVKACCRYISVRCHIFQFTEILWVPTKHATELSTCFAELFAACRDEHDRSGLLLPFQEVEDCTLKIVNHFRSRKCKSLLVLDAKRIVLASGMQKLAYFIETLLKATKGVKILVLHRPGTNIAGAKMPCAESNIEVPPLDFKNTAALFGRLCQHVKNRVYSTLGTASELSQLLVGSHAEVAPGERMSKRLADTYAKIGNGIPELIMGRAKKISKDEFRRLIETACRAEPHLPTIDSRAALEKKFRELSEEIARACTDRHFERAQEFQESLDELELLRTEFPDLRQLMTMARDVRADQEFAIQSKDFMVANELQKELTSLELKIRTERDVMLAYGLDPIEVVSRERDDTKTDVEERRETRASLSASVRLMEEQLAQACDADNYDKAREVDAQISNLKRQLLSMPDCETLANRVFEMKTELKQLKYDRRWDEAEALHTEITRTESILATERKMEAELKIKDEQRNDPPGSYGTIEGIEEDWEPESRVRGSLDDQQMLRLPLPRRSRPATSEEFNDDNYTRKTQITVNASPGATQRQPGAVAISGCNASLDDAASFSSVGDAADGSLPVAELVKTSLEEQEALSQSIQDDLARRAPVRRIGSASNHYTLAMISGATEASNAEPSDLLVADSTLGSISRLSLEPELEDNPRAATACTRGEIDTQQAAPGYLPEDQVVSTPAQGTSFPRRAHEEPNRTEESEDDRVARLVEEAMDERLSRMLVSAESVEVEGPTAPTKNGRLRELLKRPFFRKRSKK